MDVVLVVLYRLLGAVDVDLMRFCFLSSSSSSDDGAAVPARKSGRFGGGLKVLGGHFLPSPT